MKRVGIMSMQRIYNYGSFLQAYGLKSIIEELGANVEFVDYQPGECIEKDISGLGIKRKIIKSIDTLLIRTKISNKYRYLRYKKNYEKRYYPYLNIKEKSYKPKLDLLIIGSDEVFNCVQSNANVGFSPDLFGVNCNANRLISYAASFGNTTLKKIIYYNLEETLTKYFQNFYSISVRDNNSYEIVSQLSNNSIDMHLDPVLIYDYDKKCKYIKEITVPYKFLILYGYSGRFSKEESILIKKFAKKNNLKILNFGGIQHYSDIFIDCTPFEMLGYFKAAEYVITDTFHGSIFSIISSKKFVTCIRTQGYGNYEKLSDLLKRLNLQDRILDDINKLDAVINEDIDYNSISIILEKERMNAYQYLKNNIDID